MVERHSLTEMNFEIDKSKKDALAARVLHIVPCLDHTFGGQTVSAPNLATTLLAQGWRSVFVSVTMHERETENLLMEPHVAYWREARRSSLLNVGHLSTQSTTLIKETIEKHQPKLIHLHSIWNHLSWTAFEIARKRGLPVIISPRSELFAASLKRSWKKKAIARLLYANRLLDYASGFHATDSNEEAAIRALGISAPVLISPNGVDFSLGKDLPTIDQAKADLGLPIDRRYMLFLSRLHARKNPDLFLRAAIDADVFDKGWDIIIAGPEEDPKLVAVMHREVENSGLTGRVHWMGQVGWETKRLCYAACEIYALPTEFENFGHTIAEALACNKPVITSATTPWADLPATGAGWIVAPEIEALSAVYRAASALSKDELKVMGEKGRDVVHQFSWERAGKEMADFYWTTIEKGLHNPT